MPWTSNGYLGGLEHEPEFEAVLIISLLPSSVTSRIVLESEGNQMMEGEILPIHFRKVFIAHLYL